MGNSIDVTSNVIKTNADGEVLGSGDSIFVDFGVKVEGNNSGATQNAVWDGIHEVVRTGTGINATIEGTVVGSFDGISVDYLGGSNITIGTSASVISTDDALGTAGAAGGTGIHLGAGTNTVTNNGQITGINEGVAIAGTGFNDVVNNGTISAKFNAAIDLAGTSNNVTNTGLLTTEAAAILLDGTSGDNNIDNSGQIEANWGIYSSGGVDCFIINSGTVLAEDYAIQDAGTAAFFVSNSGLLSGEGGILFNSTSNADSLINTGTIQALGNSNAVVEDAAGAISVQNSGIIAGGEGDLGGAIEDDEGSNSHVQNSIGGVVSGNNGIYFGNGDNSIVNHGDITGANDGIAIIAGTSFEGGNFVTNTGTISGGGLGLVDAGGVLIFGGDNRITNSGTITGNGVGVQLQAGSDAHGNNALVNSGTITGLAAGVRIAGENGDHDVIHNSGAIHGGQNAGQFGVEDTLGGALTITNDGTISGTNAISFDSGAGDVLHNSGKISGASAVTELGTGVLSVVNTGHIVGDVDFGSGGGSYNGVSGVLDGAVNGGAGEDTIKGGADGETLNGGGGSDLIKGGAGDDVIDGGTGADKLVGGGGNDTFVYTGVSDSKGVGTHDTIVGFDALSDTFDFEVAVTGVGQAITAGTLNQAAFNVDLQAIVTATALHAHDAVLVTPNAGDLAGHTYLVIDDNGTAGYQAATDYVIELSQGVHLANLSASNFI